MGKLKSKVGKENINNFGSKMIIVDYKKYHNISVYFPEYDYVVHNKSFGNFEKGKISCPYEKRTLGLGFLGEGEYKTCENGKLKIEHDIWYNMLKRCYDPKYQEKHPTYKGCRVEDYLLNFQHMGKWIENNYYEVPNERMCLDKDILHKGNKIYSRDTCIFVPQRINKLFIKSDNSRGKNPIGVHEMSSGNYRADCNKKNGKKIYLGTYKTKEEAFRVYKEYKEKVIKEVIDSYEGIIPEPHYSRLREAMYNYKVEIDD